MTGRSISAGIPVSALNGSSLVDDHVVALAVRGASPRVRAADEVIGGLWRRLDASDATRGNHRCSASTQPAPVVSHPQPLTTLPPRSTSGAQVPYAAEYNGRAAVINLHEIPPRTVVEGDIAFDRRRIGPVAGTQRIGVSWYEVPAGRRQMPVHVHGEEEEIFYVLAGGGLAWQQGRGVRDRARRRDRRTAPTGGPHTLLAGDDGMTVLAFDSGSESGLTFLPRARGDVGRAAVGAARRAASVPGRGLAGPLERPVVDPGQPRPANVVGLGDVEPERPSRLRAARSGTPPARSRPGSTT